MEITNNLPSNQAVSDFDLNVEKQEQKQKVKKVLSYVLTYLLLTVAAILCLFPFLWMILTSFKTLSEYQDIVPSFFPKGFYYQNYINAFEYSNNLFSRTLLNSIFVGLTSTFLGLILTVLAAYAFARMKFAGREFLFSCLLMTMMIPGELFTTTNFITTTSDLKWGDTLTIMIVPFLVSVYYIYLLRNAFKQIPETLYKAAKVDGCSDFKYLIKVMVPMTAPTIVSITILKLIGVWNSYMWPQLVNSPQWRLVSNWMAQCGIGSDGTDYPMKMAAAVIISIPLFIVFMLFRKYIMKGVSRSGIKG